MTGRPKLPKPDGFDAFAADHASNEIAKHFKIARERTNRLLREMPADWRKARTKTLQIRAGRCNVEAAVKAAKVANTKPIPEGFVEVLMTTTRSAACKHFNIPSSTLYAMFKRLPIETQDAISAAGQERKREASSRNALKAGAASKAKRTPGKASGVNWGFNKPVDIAPVSGGVVAMAAQHLRRVERHVAPICAATVVLGKAGAGFYKYGTKLVPEAFIVERAKATGWDADAWRKVT